MIFDFHTHTSLSDGALSPMELINRARVAGYTALGIADHSAAGTTRRIIAEVAEDCEVALRHWGFPVLAGIEITHAPPEAIADLAAEAKAAGARCVVVHGETPVEPVPAGTNLAACSCPDVDILAHPGMITLEAARAAAQNGVFLEITRRQGHSLTNGHVVRVATQAGAALLVNTDAHSPGDLLTEQLARVVATGAGLPPDEAEMVLIENPKRLLARAGIRL